MAYLEVKGCQLALPEEAHPASTLTIADPPIGFEKAQVSRLQQRCSSSLLQQLCTVAPLKHPSHAILLFGAALIMSLPRSRILLAHILFWMARIKPITIDKPYGFRSAATTGGSR
jgi:hypothetical protein